MSFNGNEGGPVSRETARKWIKNYQASASAQTSPKAHFFGKDNIQKLLSLEGCVGIRIYLSENDSGDLKPLIVATNSEMEDILPADMNSNSEDGPMILDFSFPCPPYCATTEI